MVFFGFLAIFSASANEVYPAIVGPAGVLPNTYSTVLARENDPPVKEARRDVMIPTVPQISPPMATRAPGTDYYRVPDEQTQSLVTRLSLVRSLMERHGRAYDYREHTISDLKQKLDELDSAAVIGP